MNVTNFNTHFLNNENAPSAGTREGSSYSVRKSPSEVENAQCDSAAITVQSHGMSVVHVVHDVSRRSPTARKFTAALTFLCCGPSEGWRSHY